jgi:hypothetical protein
MNPRQWRVLMLSWATLVLKAVEVPQAINVQRDVRSESSNSCVPGPCDLGRVGSQPDFYSDACCHWYSLTADQPVADQLIIVRLGCATDVLPVIKF